MACSIAPRNGLYLTSADFPQWHEELTTGLGAYEGRDLDVGNVREITFVVTERCNLRCTYCYEGHDLHACGKRMSKETGERIIDFIFDEEKVNGYYDFSKDDGCRAVILEFIGGEPLLEIDLIDHLVDYFRAKALALDHEWAYHHAINISTNGTLYNTEKVQRFIKKNRENLSISISIDGNKQLHDACRVFPDGSGSYDVVVKAVEKWLEQYPHAQTKGTLAPENLMYLCDSVKHLWSLGILGIHANPVYENVWKPEHAVIYYDQLTQLADYILENDLYLTRWISLFDDSLGGVAISDRNYCGGNGAMLAFDTEGRAFPCLRFMKHSLRYQEETPIGDINSKMDSIEENKWLRDLMCVTMSSQSPIKCLDCPVSAGCGVCIAWNYDLNGDPNKRATCICEMHKARVLANCYYWNKLYRKLDVDKRFPLNLSEDEVYELIGRDRGERLLKEVRSNGI
jgi:uncharacterized protein